MSGTQKLHPIEVKKYEPRSTVTKLDNGLIVVSLRRIMDQEVIKIVPILEDHSLTKLIVFDLHQEDFS